MNWQAFGLWAYSHLKVFFAGIGLTGGGVGFIKYMKHVPAPLKKSIWWGSVFDTIQDLISNNERIGQRRDADSAFVTKTEAGGKTASAQTVTLPNETPLTQEKSS